MLSIAIVDDDVRDIEVLNEYLNRYASENKIELSISIFQEAITFLEGYDSKYDIVFMDVSMPYYNGFQTSKKLRQLDDSVVLVFVTTMEKYAIKGYEVNALDYVIKPLEYQSFSVKLRRIIREAEKRKKSSILVEFNKEHTKVDIRDIVYLESEKHTIKLHLADGTELLSRQSLGSFEAMLTPRPFSFIRCNNSYLVNPRHIVQIKESTVYLRDGELPIARPRKSEVMKQFAQYMGGGYD